MQSSLDITKFISNWENETRTANSNFQSQHLSSAYEQYSVLLDDCLKYISRLDMVPKAYQKRILDCFLITSENITEIFKVKDEKLKEIKSMASCLDVLIRLFQEESIPKELRNSILKRFSRCYLYYLKSVENINPKLSQKILNDLMNQRDRFDQFFMEN